MAKGDKPTHDVLISNDGHYTKIGAGWEVAKEGISVQLSALPVDGKLVIFPVRKQDDG